MLTTPDLLAVYAAPCSDATRALMDAILIIRPQFLRNIPGKTRVLSIAIYEHVETLRYTEAHTLSAGLILFSFCVLFAVYTLNRRYRVHVG